uniref:uncharacterized protein LOC120890416 n=1 Tax=Ictidomys tridecemlineatus TaxID=43179 RepID=UPI001A9D6C90|nr:uncharacterized protein LOC120890416 [Ictidomys tridecemlineatus]
MSGEASECAAPGGPARRLLRRPRSSRVHPPSHHRPVATARLSRICHVYPSPCCAALPGPVPVPDVHRCQPSLPMCPRPVWFRPGHAHTPHTWHVCVRVRKQNPGPAEAERCPPAEWRRVLMPVRVHLGTPSVTGASWSWRGREGLAWAAQGPLGFHSRRPGEELAALVRPRPRSPRRPHGGPPGSCGCGRAQECGVWRATSSPHEPSWAVGSGSGLPWAFSRRTVRPSGCCPRCPRRAAGRLRQDGPLLSQGRTSTWSRPPFPLSSIWPCPHPSQSLPPGHLTSGHRPFTGTVLALSSDRVLRGPASV